LQLPAKRDTCIGNCDNSPVLQHRHYQYKAEITANKHR